MDDKNVFTGPSQDAIKSMAPMTPIVLVDFDGTLSDPAHRLHHLDPQGPNWDAFYDACDQDPPNDRVIQVVRMLSVSYPIVIPTGRSADVMEKSIVWLHQHGVPYASMIMRSPGDHTADHALKRLWAQEYHWGPESVLCVLEDRSSVVEMWRGLGITCLQVAEGDF